MKRRSLLLAAAILIIGCASAPEEPVVSTPVVPTRTIAYRAPAAPVTLTYTFADTTNSNIQAGPAGTINVGITARGTAELRFEPLGADQKVTLTLADFTGQFSNSAGGGTMTATTSDMRGPIVFTLDARGVANVTTRPELTANFRMVVGSENNFRRFFTRVPAGPVRIGAVWTDTASSEETNEGITSKLRNILHTTYARDTVIAGQTLHVLTGEGERFLEVAGTSQGVEIVQKLTGKVSSTVLWDPQRNAVVLKDEQATLGGTFDLPAMNLTGMPISATGRTIIQLRPN